ncbi:glycoside hydrolase family 65 protein [Mycoplasma iguanae]|uniref:Glycoside hydrolase family 65 protein n=1 Tax=Mycoplasma iguanae TaxID=292461 RepID=A0ABY5R8T3_9MOLU|nr:glycosyl hydrolase family 65 protein [Mycoplasma iguanae]UVD81908.1 glycoside hydrolase family 65 protein [Mycoplasma iguanae]
MAKLIYDLDNKIISQIGYDKLKTAKTESIFAQGNGFLGIRAVDEERSIYNKEDFFIAGLFNKGDKNETTELANMADLLQTSILIDGEIFEILPEFEYSKSLDLKTGELKRTIRFQKNNKSFEFIFQRFVSQEFKNFYFQKITLKQLSGYKTKIKISPMINGQTTNRGIQHFDEGFKKYVSKNTLQYEETTNESNIFVIHSMAIKAYLNNKLLESGNDDYVIKMHRRQVGFDISFELETNQEFKLEKNMSVFTNLNQPEKTKKDIITQALKNIEILENQSYEDFAQDNTKHWNNIYQEFDVKIHGKTDHAKYTQLALMFAIFHMNTFVPKNNPFASVGAKGLSGEGYQGHCYWDTEFFINPNYLFTNPSVAKNLLIYRYKGIEGARKKAAESNLKGAQYPWESAQGDSGEVTPFWGQPDVKTFKQVPIASRNQEIHVSGDVAFAFDQYYQVTKDQKFMEDYGYEVIIDTAIYWAYRAEKKDEYFVITNVMGPNEYKGNIDNNNFINLVAKRNLELALGYIQELKSTAEGKLILEKVNQKIPYDYDINLMQKVAEKLVQQLPNENNIIAENDQFLKLPLIDVKPFQCLGDAGKKLFNTTEGHKRLASQIVKQADVVLSTFIFGELFSQEVAAANFDYYEPITTHDSSLSATTYTIKAIDFRKMDIAKKLFDYSINIDLGQNMFSSNEGIHAGSLAAIWQSIVFGYGGMRFLNKKLHFNPILHDQWEGLEYSILYENNRILVHVLENQFTLQLIEGNGVDVYVNNQPYKLTKNKVETFGIIQSW